MNAKTTKVIFYQVKDNAAKTSCICNKVHEVIQKEKKILIAVSNSESAKYVDDLLWRVPEESFLPHSKANEPTSDWVVITEVQQNVNQANCLFNLCSVVSSIAQQFEVIFELFDLTHPEKAKISEKKMKDYQAMGLKVTVG